MRIFSTQRRPTHGSQDPHLTTLLTYTNLIAAVVNGLIVGAVIVRARRKRLGFPPLVVLIVLYFTNRAIDRLAAPDPFLGYRPAVDAVTDVVSITLLTAIFVMSGRLIDAMLRSHDEERYQRGEYARARREYTQIVRHRVMNPLTVIGGSASTLLTRPELDERTRSELLEAIVDAATEIEQVSLEPERAGVEERGFDAVPRPRGSADLDDE